MTWENDDVEIIFRPKDEVLARRRHQAALAAVGSEVELSKDANGQN